MTRAASKDFPHKWEIEVPMAPCPDSGCGRLHGGHVAVGADPGCLYIGLVSDLGDGALRLTPEQAFEFNDDLTLALGVMIGMDMSDITSLVSDLQFSISEAFEAAEKGDGNE